MLDLSQSSPAGKHCGATGGCVGAGTGARVGSRVRGVTGARVRTRVGRRVGAGTGARVGARVGRRVGARVGARVGRRVGAGTGARVGARVGRRVGAGTGARVGARVGRRVGAGTGARVGGRVGALTGASVSSWGVFLAGNREVRTSRLGDPSKLPSWPVRASEVIELVFLPDSKYKAATPATCGDAMDVPDFVLVPPVLAVDRIPVPGAKISTQLPQLDQLVR
jgi:hypothetical protein